MLMRTALVLPTLLLLAGCAASDAVTPPAAEPALESRTPATPEATVGRVDVLDCGEDQRSFSLSVDYDEDAVGFPTAAEAAHVLADERGLPRSRLTERAATGTVGQPVFEYLSEDGRVVAYVSVERWLDERWLASTLTACQGLTSR